MAKPTRPRKRNAARKGLVERRRQPRRADEALLADITANVPVAIFRRVLRRDGTYAVLFASAGTYEIFGRDPAKTEPDDLLDAIHPDDRERWSELNLESAANLTPLDFEMRVRTEAGETRWVRTIARPHATADGEVVWDGVDFHITAEKRTEDALREAETRYSSIVTNLPGTVFRRVQHTDGRIEYPYMSPTLLDFIGVDAETVVEDARLLINSTHPDDRAYVAESYGRSARDLSPVDMTRRMITAMGAIKWVRTIARPEAGPDGAVVWNGITLDVTAEREAATAARERRETLNALASNIPGIIYQRVLHRDGRTTYPYVGDGVRRVYGHDAAEVAADPTILLTAATPEDQASHDESLRHSAESLSPWHWEGRVRTKEGAVKWIEASGQPRRLESGATLWDCFLFDVTERKQVAKALADSSSHFEAVLENMAQGLVALDADLNIQFINDQARAFLGHPPDILSPGVNFGRAVALGAARGDYGPGDPAALAAARMEAIHDDRDLVSEQKMPEGRIVEVRKTSLPPGGYVITYTDLTERRLAEAGLRDSEARLRDIAEAASEWFWEMDSDLIFTFGSDRFFELTGWTPGELYGQGRVKLVHPELEDLESEKWRRHFALLKRHEPFRDFEYAARKSDGSPFYLSLSGNPVFSADGTFLGYRGAGLDINERRRAEAELRKLSLAVGQSPISVVIFDTDGIVEYVNPTFTTITGIPHADAMGTPSDGLWAMIGAADAHRGIWGNLEFEDPARGEYVAETTAGKRFWFRESVTPIRGTDGAITHYLSIGEDISGYKEMEIGLMQASKLSSLGEMAASLTHELNQPLNVIRAAADGSLILAEDGLDDVEYFTEQLAVISRQTTRMAEIIKHMRVYSRGDMTTAAPFYPLPIVRGGVDLMANEMRLADIEVRLALPLASAQVRGHAVRLEQVIVALLTNAKDAILSSAGGDAGQEGSQEFRGAIEVALQDRPGAGEVVITVTDSGGGIPDDVIDRIFTSFFTTKPIGEGTGLGLAVAQNIVAEMEGSIEVANTGSGARFRIALPAFEPEVDATGDEPGLCGPESPLSAPAGRGGGARHER